MTVLPLASIIWDEEHAASSLVRSGPPGQDTHTSEKENWPVLFYLQERLT
jgi:hypothetical protein